MNGKNMVERLECPRIIRLGFFGKKTEGDRECLIFSRHSSNMEEQHLVFVVFVGAVEEKDGMVGGKDLEGRRMTEKSSFEFTIFIHLRSQREAGFLEDLIEMNHRNDGCLVGEGGFLFCVVDCADGGEELFFWVILLQCLEDLGRFESRIG